MNSLNVLLIYFAFVSVYVTLVFLTSANNKRQRAPWFQVVCSAICPLVSGQYVSAPWIWNVSRCCFCAITINIPASS